MPTFTLTDTQTKLVIVETEDRDEVRRHIAAALAYEPSPNWLQLTVVLEQGTAVLDWQRVVRWYQAG